MQTFTEDEKEARCEVGKISNVPVRFFMEAWIEDDNEEGYHDTIECAEAEFLEADGEIQYERHTRFENGSSQICLTKKERA